jgi:hypothetical protein
MKDSNFAVQYLYTILNAYMYNILYLLIFTFSMITTLFDDMLKFSSRVPFQLFDPLLLFSVVFLFF